MGSKGEWCPGEDVLAYSHPWGLLGAFPEVPDPLWLCGAQGPGWSWRAPKAIP